MSSFTGTGALARLALRRDRVLLPVFMVIFVAMIAGGTSATIALYPDTASRVSAATVINTAPSTLAMFGPIHDLTSIGALSTFKTGMMDLLALAILALRLVVRHTRAEEETGRLEMLRATVVGRYAPLTAAALVAIGASLVAGAGTAVGLIATGLPAAGSVLVGAGFACTGIAFAAVGTLTAQLTVSARAAAGMGTVALGGFYLLRAVGDAAPGGDLHWMSWLSPLGWWQMTRPFAGDRWWPLALLLVFAAAFLMLAYEFAIRRDFAAGLLPDRPGPANAPPGLRSPLALAWRLDRASSVAWALAIVTVGAVVGGLTSSIDSFLQSQTAQDLFTKLGGAQSLTDVFLAVELGFLGIFVSVYGLQTVLRLRSEETGLVAEPVLATSVGRVKWALSHLTVALVGSAALLLLAGLSVGATSAAQVGDIAQLGRVLAGALVQIPAVWLVIGIGFAAFGLVPQQTVMGWVALVAFVLLGEFGRLFELNQAVIDLSPFAHVPRLPGGEFTVAPMLWLTAIAIIFVAGGLVGFRRRNVG